MPAWLVDGLVGWLGSLVAERSGSFVVPLALTLPATTAALDSVLITVLQEIKPRSSGKLNHNINSETTSRMIPIHHTLPVSRTTYDVFMRTPSW